MDDLNIVTPYARLMPPPDDRGWDEAKRPDPRQFTSVDGLNLLRRIEWCARISHRSEETQTADSWDRFIRAVVLFHGDWSVTEHASVTVDAVVDRGVTHEIVRHRLFGFTQESTRFVNYEKKMPPSYIQPIGLDNEQLYSWKLGITASETQYKQMLAKGCAPQIARSVFPNALASRIVITGNLRNWRHFLIMRTTRETHPQMREVTIPLLAEFKAVIPILYEDIEPLGSQAAAIKRAR